MAATKPLTAKTKTPHAVAWLRRCLAAERRDLRAVAAARRHAERRLARPARAVAFFSRKIRIHERRVADLLAALKRLGAT